MEQNLTTPIEVAANYWAAQLRQPSGIAIRVWESQVEVFTEALRREFEKFLPVATEGKLVCITHNHPGSYLHVAFDKAWGSNIKYWPSITRHWCMELYANLVRVGSNEFSSPYNWEIVWQGGAQ